MMTQPILRRLAAGERAPDLTISDAAGEAVTLSSLWADRPVVLSFLRHFG